MNTSALKKFAREARIKLLDLVETKIDFVLSADTVQLRGMSKQLDELREQIKSHSKEQVTEKVAYTWFNRLMALRFMDANGYNSPMVVTPTPGGHVPEILQESKAGVVSDDLQLDRTRLNDLLDGKTQVADAQTEAYKILLIGSCNALYNVMPFMFERISDYTELLLPDDLLSEFSIVTDICEGMSDDDCKQEELIGWLYQFYIADKKDEVFDGLKKNVKITPENIPAATQLFTPRWIVRYMVENTLGKLWLTFRPQSKLRDHMPYFLEAPEGNEPSPLPEGINGITDITFLDPCMGSGHILVYAFDLFSKIYEEEGFNNNEIPGLIFQHNLYGIDIDERAAQLAAFALTMKARSYYSRFLRKNVQPNVIALESISGESIRQSIKMPLSIHGKLIFKHEELNLWQLTEANNFGSLIQIQNEETSIIASLKVQLWQNEFEKLNNQTQLLGNVFHCVVTNPPYMGGKGMNAKMRSFVEQNFPKTKYDLMAAFIERCLAFSSKNGKIAMINQHSWMFLTSYEELRVHLIENALIESMLHLGSRTFPEIGGEVVQNTTFVLSNNNGNNKGIFIRLTHLNSSVEKSKKTLESIQNLSGDSVYQVFQRHFEKIPGSPIAYWAGSSIINLFLNKRISDYAVSKAGIVTGNDSILLKQWWEISFVNISTSETKYETNQLLKWVPINKGGTFKKFYGNNEHILNISDLWTEGKTTKSVRRGEKDYYFKEAITWSMVASGNASFRYSINKVFGVASPSIFLNDTEYQLFLLGVLNSKIVKKIIALLNPTLNILTGDIMNIPVVFPKELNKVNDLVKWLIINSKADWDSRERSWDFQQNELLKWQNLSLAEAIELHTMHWSKIFLDYHWHEEELNRELIKIYGLESELNPDLDVEDITILQDESKFPDRKLHIDPSILLMQFISYSVGCIFGRYSLDKPGLILTSQGQTLNNFLEIIPNPTFLPDADNLLPILDGEWFNNDVVVKSKDFLKRTFGDLNFNKNMKFIETIIRKEIQKYFRDDFYNDHVKKYNKRPIYWMFSSSKGTFKMLMYMHRYQPDTCSKVLNDYLRVYISKLESEKQTLTQTSISGAATVREKTQATKRMVELESIFKELREYETKLFDIAAKKIEIDLDDGVKVNYLKFKDVLVPIKGLEKDEE